MAACCRRMRSIVCSACCRVTATRRTRARRRRSSRTIFGSRSRKRGGRLPEPCHFADLREVPAGGRGSVYFLVRGVDLGIVLLGVLVAGCTGNVVGGGRPMPGPGVAMTGSAGMGAVTGAAGAVGVAGTAGGI